MWCYLVIFERGYVWWKIRTPHFPIHSQEYQCPPETLVLTYWLLFLTVKQKVLGSNSTLSKIWVINTMLFYFQMNNQVYCGGIPNPGRRYRYEVLSLLQEYTKLCYRMIKGPETIGMPHVNGTWDGFIGMIQNKVLPLFQWNVYVSQWQSAKLELGKLVLPVNLYDCPNYVIVDGHRET